MHRLAGIQHIFRLDKKLSGHHAIAVADLMTDCLGVAQNQRKLRIVQFVMWHVLQAGPFSCDPCDLIQMIWQAVRKNRAMITQNLVDPMRQAPDPWVVVEVEEEFDPMFASIEPALGRVAVEMRNLGPCRREAPGECALAQRPIGRKELAHDDPKLGEN